MGRRLVASVAVLSVSAICPVAASAVRRSAAPAAVAVASIAAASVTFPAASFAIAAAPSRVVLEPLTREEMVAAQTIDIGCYWSSLDQRGVRFAASDDHAAVKIGGGVVRLRPADGARDMFPFTFDRWTGGGMSVLVEKTAARKVRSGSMVAGRTRLLFRRGEDVARLSGTMECGG